MDKLIQSEMKNVLLEEHREIVDDMEYTNECIKMDRERCLYIERIIDFIDKLSGSSMIKDMIRDDLYDLKVYYVRELAETHEELDNEKEQHKIIENRSEKLSRIMQAI